MKRLQTRPHRSPSGDAMGSRESAAFLGFTDQVTLGSLALHPCRHRSPTLRHRTLLPPKLPAAQMGTRTRCKHGVRWAQGWCTGTEARSGTQIKRLWESKSTNPDQQRTPMGRSLGPEGPGWPEPGAEPARGRSFHTRLPGFFLRPPRLRRLRLPLGGLFVYKQITSAPPSLPGLWARPPAALLPAPSGSEPAYVTMVRSLDRLTTAVTLRVRHFLSAAL